MNRVESKAQDDNRMEGNLKASRIPQGKKATGIVRVFEKAVPVR
jgi:hypothetical protein